MTDNSLFDELSRRVAALMPAAEHLREELRTKIAQVLKSGMKEFDVLSREEFEAQRRSLERAQQRVEELERRLRDLEAALGDSEPTAGRQ